MNWKACCQICDINENDPQLSSASVCKCESSNWKTTLTAALLRVLFLIVITVTFWSLFCNTFFLNAFDCL